MKFISCCLVLSAASLLPALPGDFVFLSDVDPSILQEIRYATGHNFMGKADRQYQTGTCILRRPVAEALKEIQQKQLLPRGLSFKVFDCYRPHGTVTRFVDWVSSPVSLAAKNRYFPRVEKTELIVKSYIGSPSLHSKGIAVDLTIVRVDGKNDGIQTQQPVCGAGPLAGNQNPELEMGTGFDCFDEKSRSGAPENLIGKNAFANRRFLRKLMQAQGFKPYTAEWWHFRFADTQAGKIYFDFDVISHD